MWLIYGVTFTWVNWNWEQEGILPVLCPTCIATLFLSRKSLFLYMTVTQFVVTFVSAPECSRFLVNPKGRIIALVFFTFASFFFISLLYFIYLPIFMSVHITVSFIFKKPFMISNSFILIISTSSLFQWENTGNFFHPLKGFYNTECVCLIIFSCFLLSTIWSLGEDYLEYLNTVPSEGQHRPITPQRLLPVVSKKVSKTQ